MVHESEIEGASGGMWPMEAGGADAGRGGPVRGSTVTVWEPPRRFSNRMDGENGFVNQPDCDISELPDGKSWLRYVHSGVFFPGLGQAVGGASQHTAFCQHTLGQYMKFFAGKQAAFADVLGPAASSAPHAFWTVKAACGIPDAGAGGHVSVPMAGLGTVDAAVDCLDKNFFGLRTEGAGPARSAWLNGLYK